MRVVTSKYVHVIRLLVFHNSSVMVARILTIFVLRVAPTKVIMVMCLVVGVLDGASIGLSTMLPRYVFAFLHVPYSMVSITIDAQIDGLLKKSVVKSIIQVSAPSTG